MPCSWALAIIGCTYLLLAHMWLNAVSPWNHLGSQRTELTCASSLVISSSWHWRADHLAVSLCSNMYDERERLSLAYYFGAKKGHRGSFRALRETCKHSLPSIATGTTLVGFVSLIIDQHGEKRLKSTRCSSCMACLTSCKSRQVSHVTSTFICR